MNEQDFCTECDEVVDVVDVHDEEDHRDRWVTLYTVFDLACGHSIQVVRR